MKITKLLRVGLLILAALTGTNIHASNIDLDVARTTANSFLKHRYGAAGFLRVPSLSDLRLAHAEVSSVDPNAKAYYAFNIDGGGFIIVSGDDRASQVLGFSDKGRLDFNNIPDNLMALLEDYKKQIEYLQAHPKMNVPPCRTSENYEVIVKPLIQTHWGQLTPYNQQCPVGPNGVQCKVGCSGVQMAQILYYWRYPTTCGPLEGYYCSRLGITLDELPETTFDYDKMLTSYCHWDPELGEAIQDVYTEEQAQAVAKLCRYVGQAGKIDYSIGGSSCTGPKKLAGMKTLGYNPNAKSINRTSYTTEAWEKLMRNELDAGRPIMYGAKNATSSTGHAFIFDGYDNEGYFHINLGWFGNNDGWFLTTAIITTNLNGDYREYSKDNYMFLNIEPTAYCRINAEGIDAEDELLFLGSDIHPLATGVNIYMSYSDVDLMFALTDHNGNQVATSDLIHVEKGEFVQRSDISSAITLPTALADGTYDLQFGYLIDDSMTVVGGAQGKLTVAGKFAKFNANFDIQDVTTAIDYLLNDMPTGGVQLNISDITTLIDLLLAQ